VVQSQTAFHFGLNDRAGLKMLVENALPIETEVNLLIDPETGYLTKG